jgi:hypothetical protein
MKWQQRGILTGHVRLAADGLDAGVVDDGALGAVIRLLVLFHHVRDTKLAHPEYALEVDVHDLLTRRKMKKMAQKKRALGWVMCCNTYAVPMLFLEEVDGHLGGGWLNPHIVEENVYPAELVDGFIDQALTVRSLDRACGGESHTKEHSSGNRTLGGIKGNEEYSTWVVLPLLSRAPFFLQASACFLVGVLQEAGKP